MARQRLTKEAIAYIIECREDPTQINTWQDIAELVAEKFKIEVTFQAIAKSYSKNKDDPYFKGLASKPNSKPAGHAVTTSKLEPKNLGNLLSKTKQSSKEILKKFDNNDDVDLNDFFE